jgi:hypothetical protein
MAVFYFNVFNHETTIDETGAELADLAEARDEARNAAADLIREEILAGRKLHRDHRIEIEDAERHLVHVLRFGEFVAD